MVGIAAVEAKDRERVHYVIRAEDDRLNEIDAELSGGISCKIYVQRACQRLKAVGRLEFSDWEHLEKKVLETGDQHESAKGIRVTAGDSEVTNLDKIKC